MSRTTTIRAIAKRTGVTPRVVLSALPAVGVTGKHKYTKKIDKSLSSKIESQLMLPYTGFDYYGPRNLVFDEFEASVDETPEPTPPPVQELVVETEFWFPPSTPEENQQLDCISSGGWTPSLTERTVSSVPTSVESPKMYSIPDFDRFVDMIAKSSSTAPADLEERNNRLRCVEGFGILYKILAQIGIPSATWILQGEYNNRVELPFSVYRRILFNALGSDLVRKLNLKSLLSTAKNYRNAVAHVDQSSVSGATAKWIADGVENLALELMDCSAEFAEQCDYYSSENWADSFYEFFKFRQGARYFGAEGVQ